jgi:uncharacterized membrane protein required for colicin V production
MHLFDIIFLGLAAVLVGIGVWRGLITEAFRLLAIFLGFVVAMRAYGDVYERIGFLSLAPGVKVALSFLLLFAAVAVAVLASGWLLRKMVHLTVLGWVDRLGGAGIGFVKALLIAWAVSLMLEALPAPKLHASLERSVVYTTCSWLPTRLRLPGVAPTRASIDEFVSHEGISSLPEKLDQFRGKVDSVKHSGGETK